MQLNPLSIEPVAAAIAIAQKRGRLEEVADLVEEAVERQPENPDVWLRAYAVQQFVDDAPARIASVQRGCSSSTRTRDRVPFDAVAGRRRRPVGQRHRHAARRRGAARRRRPRSARRLRTPGR